MCCLRRRNWVNVKLHVRELVQSIALALNVPSLPVLQDNYINDLYQYLQDFDCNIFALLVCWGRDGGSWGRGCPSEGTFHCPRTCTITEGGIHSILMIMWRFDKQRKRLPQLFLKKHKLFLLPISLFKTEHLWHLMVHVLCL